MIELLSYTVPHVLEPKISVLQALNMRTCVPDLLFHRPTQEPALVTANTRNKWERGFGTNESEWTRKVKLRT